MGVFLLLVKCAHLVLNNGFKQNVLRHNEQPLALLRRGITNIQRGKQGSDLLQQLSD
jgi:hypothetical protein